MWKLESHVEMFEGYAGVKFGGPDSSRRRVTRGQSFCFGPPWAPNGVDFGEKKFLRFKIGSGPRRGEI